jgi:hypothetical protein
MIKAVRTVLLMVGTINHKRLLGMMKEGEKSWQNDPLKPQIIKT